MINGSNIKTVKDSFLSVCLPIGQFISSVCQQCIWLLALIGLQCNEALLCFCLFLIKKAKKTGKQKDWKSFHDIKKKAQKICHDTYNNYISDMLEEDSASNPKKFWSFIKSKRADSSGVAPLWREGILFSDSNMKANILNDQFTSVFSTETADEIPSKGDSPYSTVPNINITTPGVIKLLNNINPHKATGPDSIPGKLLKELAQEISPALTLIFNASLHQGIKPSQWSKATVVPLFKKGNKGKASNYRPVSLTSITCKIMEHIMHSNIINSFALNFLTILFSQCHIYFNCKGHSGTSSL